MPEKIKNYITCVFILGLSSIALFHLSIRLISETHVYQAKTYYNNKDYNQAVEHLEKAAKFQPGNALLFKDLGKAFNDLARKGKDTYQYFKKSRNAFLESIKKNPLDARVFFGLAKVEYKLEKMYAIQFSGIGYSPYNALEYFQEAVRLRPNSISYNFGLLRYLAGNGHTEKIPPIVRTLSQNYPPIYGYLKKEAFWNQDLRSAYIQGLEESIKKNVAPRDAHARLASLMAEDENWENAIKHYKKSITYKDFQNNANNYIHLARLYLKAGNVKKAEKNAVQALDMTDLKERTLEQFYNIYKAEGLAEQFSNLLELVRDNFRFSDRFEMLSARLLFDLKQYSQAKKIFENLNRKRPNALAYYRLYLIAKAQKDKDAMELAIQKATVFDPKNSRYHYLFSNLLKQLKKYESAEDAATQAIKTQKKPSPHMFNHRAWIRWLRQNYQGAVKDWQQAVELSPNKAAYYAYTGHAYKKLKNKKLSALYYRKALSLEPGNAKYKKVLNEIEAGI